MAVERIVLLLALASLLAVNAATTQPSAPSSGSFVEWLATQSSTDAKTASSYYEEVEKESACLRTASFDNCQCLNADCTRFHIEGDLACCPTGAGDSYHTDYTELRAEKTIVGGCSFTEERFHDGIPSEGGTTVVGTFSAMCDLKGESSECGSPLCGGMTLVVSGKILSYNNIAFTGGLSEIRTGCLPTERSRNPLKTLLDRAAKKPESPLTKEAPAAYSVGAGSIYVGNFQVVSSLHKVPYKTGRFEQVIATGESFKAASTVPEKAFVADDLNVKLDFYKSGSYNSY